MLVLAFLPLDIVLHHLFISPGHRCGIPLPTDALTVDMPPISPYTRAKLYGPPFSLKRANSCDATYFGGIEIIVRTWSEIKCPLDPEFHRWKTGAYSRKRQTSTASPAEPGDLPILLADSLLVGAGGPATTRPLALSYRECQ